MKKKKINFFYNLIKYILKKPIYIHQFQFLIETRAKILNLIKNNIGKIFTSINESEYKNQIEYILKQFIGDNSYNYFIIKSSQRHNISQQNNNYEPNLFIFPNTPVQDAHENMNNKFGSCISPFSHESYILDNKNSKRDISKEFDNEIYNRNELQYKILNNSKFLIHTNKKGETPFIIYDEIKILINGKESENKTIEEIRNATSDNDKLSNNYKKFLTFLDNFQGKLSNEFVNNYKLKIALNFETQNINNNDFIITCLYKVEIPGENIQTYKDINILDNELGEGFYCALSEINSSNYSNIEYI